MKTSEVYQQAEIAAEVVEEEYRGDSDLHDMVFEETDKIFADLVKAKLVSKYTVDDLVDTAEACTTIIKTASEHAWVEDDSGLWENAGNGTLASIAFFSLRNLIHELLPEDIKDRA